MGTRVCRRGLVAIVDDEIIEDPSRAFKRLSDVGCSREDIEEDGVSERWGRLGVVKDVPGHLSVNFGEDSSNRLGAVAG